MSFPTTDFFKDREEQRKHIARLFVKVEAALASTDGSASRPSDGGYVGLEIYGLGGIGKSRILDEVKLQCRERKLLFISVDFLAIELDGGPDDRVDFLIRLCDQLDHHYPGVSSVRALLRSLGRASGASRDRPESTSVDESALSTVIERIVATMGSQRLMLLLDSLERCSDDLFNWIGTELLITLVARLPVVAVLLAGRGAQVAASEWPKALRQNTESIRLDPLDFEATEELLGDLPPAGIYRASAKDIYELSNGHPYSTQAIAYWLSTLGIQPPQVASKREVLARRLYKEVIRQYILADAEDWVLPFVEVACVARRFDAATLMKLVGAYRPGLAPNQPVQWYIHRINDLWARPLYLIYLAQGAPIYRLDPTLRKLLHTTLAILNPAEIVAMNRSMLTFWEGLLADGRASPADLVQEIIYHAAQAALVDGGNTQQAASAAKEALDAELSAHFQTAQPSDLEQLILLRNLLLADTEMKDMLKPAGVGSLIEQLDAFLRPPIRSVQDFALTHMVVEYTPPSDYVVSWYKDNNVVVPTERVSSGRQFRLDDWRTRPEEIGKAAFRLYLPLRAQEFMRSQRDCAVQLSTDWTDVPWELLHDGTEFLCLSRPIARRPRMLREPQKYQPQPGGPVRALVIGDPQGDMPGAAVEAQAVGELLREKGVEVDLLVGPVQASANEFSIRLGSDKRYDLIHFAGHGYFDEHLPQHSGLLFADGALLAEELERGLNSRALLFLNTCSVGRSKATESIAGFQGRFMEQLATSVLLGGAVGCLAPMWDIEDAVSQDFVLAFYHEILMRQPLGEAVRLARVAVRDKGPDYWAAWVLYGNPLDRLDFLAGTSKPSEILLGRAMQDYREAAFSLTQATELKHEGLFREAVGKFLGYLEQHAHLQVERAEPAVLRIKDGETDSPCLVAFAQRPPWQLALPDRLPLIFPCLDQMRSGHFDQLPFILEQAGATGPLGLVFLSDSGRKSGRPVRHAQAIVEFAEMQPIQASQDLLETLRRLVADRIDWMIIVPYDPRMPIRTPDKYFGRKEEINAILAHLGERNHFLVGGRRSGKTSTIYVIQSHLERRVPRDLHFLGASLESVGDYDELREKLELSTPLRLPEGDISVGLLDAVKRYSLERQGAKVILAWDEVDRLVDHDAGRDWHLFGALRAESTSYRPTLTLLLAGFPVLFRSLHDGSSPFFNFGREIILRRLTQLEALDLINQPMQAMNLSIDESLSDVIYAYSAGHPSLIQGICRELMQSVLAGSQIKADRKTVEEVLESENLADLYLEVVYDNRSLAPLTRLVILKAIGLPSFGEREMVEAIRSHCPDAGIAPIQESLHLLATYLLDRRDRQYRLAMQSFPAVIAKKRDIGLEIEKVVEELRDAKR